MHACTEGLLGTSSSHRSVLQILNPPPLSYTPNPCTLGPLTRFPHLLMSSLLAHLPLCPTPNQWEEGACGPGVALILPDLPAVEAEVLQKVHRSNCAGHVGLHRTVHKVKDVHWFDSAKHARESVKGCNVCYCNQDLQKAPAVI